VFNVLVLVVQAAVPLGLVVGLLLWSRKAVRAGRVAGPLVTPGQPPTGVWNAQLLTESMLRPAYGQLRLVGGSLFFFPDGADVPAWSAPCPSLVARKQGGGLLTGAPIRIEGPMGVVEGLVSVERINRFSRNSFKTMRQQGYADPFLQALWANGARAG